MDVCQRIDWYLVRKSLSWRDLMQGLHLHASTVWRWHQGESRPRRGTILAIERFLNLPEGCLEGRQNGADREGIQRSADGLLLSGEAQQAFDALMRAETRDEESAALEKLKHYYENNREEPAVGVYYEPPAEF